MTETLMQYRRAEHLCLVCGGYDDWTEEGHRLCWRCRVQQDRRHRRDVRLAGCRSKADVMRVHGYSVQEEQR